jgi:hypothetical protein
MKTLLTVDLTKRIALLGSSPWEPPTITFGESLTLAMRCTQEIEGSSEEVSLNVQALHASVGESDARPGWGKVAFCFGDGDSTEANTTPALPCNVSASELQAAINALAEVVEEYGRAEVNSFDGSWLIVFGDGSQEVPIRGVQNP